MSITRIESDFYDVTGKRLSSVSQLNLFNILQDENLNKLLNIWRTYSINDQLINDTTYYDFLEVDNTCFWDNISYQVYKTPYLWWVLCMTNSIYNPFEDLNPGDLIKILREKYLYQLFKELKEISSFN